MALICRHCGGPLPAQAVEQIGADSTPAAERGVVVTWEYASDLAGG